MQSRTRRAVRPLARATFLAATLAGCIPPASFLAVGATAEHAPRAGTARSPSAREPDAATEPPPPRWDLAEQLRRLRPASPRTPSDHFTGQLDGEILADDGAAAYPALGPLRPIAAGATLVERLLARGTPDVAAYFAMTKRPPGYDPASGDWEYLVLDATGRIEQRGRLPACARCHVDAPRDHLFGTGR